MMTTLETSFENFVAPGRRKTQKRKSKSKQELVLRIYSLPNPEDLLSAKEEKVNRHANEGSWVLREAIAKRTHLLITFTGFL